MIGQKQVRALELIGEYDPATDSYTARAYDNLGNITIMQTGRQAGCLAVHRWWRRRLGDPAGLRRRQRSDTSTLTVSPDRSGMTARWERSDDGASWQPWMDMTFTRMP